MWPGGAFEYNGTKCTFLQDFDANITFTERIDMVMTWFTDKKSPANLVMMYIEEPDLEVHAFSPDSEQVSAWYWIKRVILIVSRIE